MALGLTQPLTEMSTRNISWGRGGKGGRCIWLTTLPPSCADCLEIWEPQAPGILRACTEIAFLFEDGDNSEIRIGMIHNFIYLDASLLSTAAYAALLSSPGRESR
jgi:hypothetical protein